MTDQLDRLSYQRYSALVPIPAQSSEDDSQLLLSYSLLKYDGLARSMILEAKLRQSMHALNRLARLTLEDQHISELFAWSDLIVSSPSSLWSRWQGHFDIAGALSAQLSVHFGKKKLRLPWVAHLSSSKQAFRSQADRFKRTKSPLPTHLDEWLERLTQRKKADFHQAFAQKNILLFDDVLTSGATLGRVAGWFHRSNLRAATLATADAIK